MLRVKVTKPENTTSELLFSFQIPPGNQLFSV